MDITRESSSNKHPPKTALGQNGGGVSFRTVPEVHDKMADSICCRRWNEVTQSHLHDQTAATARLAEPLLRSRGLRSSPWLGHEREGVWVGQRRYEGSQSAQMNVCKMHSVWRNGALNSARRGGQRRFCTLYLGLCLQSQRYSKLLHKPVVK
jgi:hypothetical protein